MGQENTFTSPLLDFDPQQVHPQPYNSRTILSSPGNRHMPRNHVHLPHLTGQYNRDHSNIFMMPPPSSGVFPGPVNHVRHDHSSFSNNHQIFERNRSLFMEGSNGGFKRKNFEGFHGNFSGSSSSVSVPMTSEGTMMDVASFGAPEHRGNNDIGLGIESGLNRTARNRASGSMGFDPVVVRNNSHMIPWLDQHSATGAFSWNHAHGGPYLQGGINVGGMEAANMAFHGYQAAAMSRNSMNFMHPPLITPHQRPHLYHPPPRMLPHMPPVQAQNMDTHLHLPSTLNRHSTTTTPNPSQNMVDPGPNFFGPAPPAGLRAYRIPRSAAMFDLSGMNQLRVVPEDGFPVLRDVGSGLSDNYISDHLKTRMFISSRSHPEDQTPTDEEPNFCVICQMEFEDGEKIGVLDCCHEYHAECIKKWLLEENNCPICKSTALPLITN